MPILPSRYEPCTTLSGSIGADVVPMWLSLGPLRAPWCRHPGPARQGALLGRPPGRHPAQQGATASQLHGAAPASPLTPRRIAPLPQSLAHHVVPLVQQQVPVPPAPAAPAPHRGVQVTGRHGLGGHGWVLQQPIEALEHGRVLTGRGQRRRRPLRGHAGQRHQPVCTTFVAQVGGTELVDRPLCFVHARFLPRSPGSPFAALTLPHPATPSELWVMIRHECRGFRRRIFRSQGLATPMG